MGYRVVVAGATGNVGREMLNILAEREFPADEVVALASRRSLGTEVSYGDKTLKTKDIEALDYSAQLDEGVREGWITDEEAAQLKELRELTLDTITVDDFDTEELRSAGYADLIARERREHEREVA